MYLNIRVVGSNFVFCFESPLVPFSLLAFVVFILMAYLRDWDEQSSGWEEWDQVSPYESSYESESDSSSSNEELAWRDLVIRRARSVVYRPPTHVWLFENLWPFLARRYGIGREWWRNFMDCLFWTPSMRTSRWQERSV